MAASKSLAKALKSKGLVESEQVDTTTLSEAASLTGLSERKVTGIWGSSAIGASDLAKKYLHWAPQHGESSWAAHFDDVVEDVK